MRFNIASLALALCFSLAGCKTIMGAIVGAGAGSFFGPGGAIAGAAGGGGAGHLLDENKRLREEIDQCRQDSQDRLDALQAKAADLERRLNAIPNAPKPETPPIWSGGGPPVSAWDRTPLSILLEKLREPLK